MSNPSLDALAQGTPLASGGVVCAWADGDGWSLAYIEGHISASPTWHVHGRGFVAENVAPWLNQLASFRPRSVIAPMALNASSSSQQALWALLAGWCGAQRVCLSVWPPHLQPWQNTSSTGNFGFWDPAILVSALRGLNIAPRSWTATQHQDPFEGNVLKEWAQLEQDSAIDLPDRPWQSHEFCLPPPMTGWTIHPVMGEDDKSVSTLPSVAYLVGQILVDRIELLRVVVQMSWRREGLGRWLVQALKQVGRERNLPLVLESHAQHKASQQLYASEGFVRIGVRRDYYPSGHRYPSNGDAIVWKWQPSVIPRNHFTFDPLGDRC